MTETLYAKLLAAGVPLDHHESDLYCKATPEAVAIIKAHEKAEGIKLSITNFFNAATRDGWWLDIPFHYQPFWDRVSRVVGGLVGEPDGGAA